MYRERERARARARAHPTRPRGAVIEREKEGYIQRASMYIDTYRGREEGNSSSTSSSSSASYAAARCSYRE
jgi:hypothetical protein